jgi:hypothetical protein
MNEGPMLASVSKRTPLPWNGTIFCISSGKSSDMGGARRGLAQAGLTGTEGLGKVAGPLPDRHFYPVREKNPGRTPC